VSEEVGLKLEEVTLSMLGRAKNVEISQDDTLVLDGAGETSAIAERCDSIKAAIDATKSEYEKEKLQERLAKLSGGVAILKVCSAERFVVFVLFFFFGCVGWRWF
jgi:chaperonin GroEL